MAVLGSIFKRKKSRLFRGTLTVLPRKDIKRHFDQAGILQYENLEASLQNNLQEIFRLPPATDVLNPTSTDLGLDVLVKHFQLGDYWDLSLGPIGIPIFWRPKITVVGRLYYLESNETKREVSVTKTMPWAYFVGRMLTWRSIFRFRPMFDAEDMNRLLCIACRALLVKLNPCFKKAHCRKSNA